MNSSAPDTAKKTRLPLKIEAFERLKAMGVPVNTVIDVGILTATGDLINAYRDKPQLLIEPIAEFEKRIREIYDNAKVNYDLALVAASDTDGETTMRTNSVREGTQITHARMTNDVDAPGDYRTVTMRTIDTLIAERSFTGPYLLKIDVDGAELQVLKGAERTLQECSVVCIEANIVNMFDRFEAVRNYGFQLFDIVDICYYDNRLAQVDLIFLKNEVIHKHQLQLYAKGFQYDLWQPFNPT